MQTNEGFSKTGSFIKKEGVFSFGSKSSQQMGADITQLSPSVQVVTGNGLTYIFQKKANDNFWKTVNSIQTNIKAKIGCGYPITVKFYAHINKEDIDETI